MEDYILCADCFEETKLEDLERCSCGKDYCEDCIDDHECDDYYYEDDNIDED